MTRDPPPQKATGGYSAREADLYTEASLIAGLWADNLVGHDLSTATTKLSLGYRNNPAGAASVHLLMVDGEPQPQGAQGLHTRRFWLGERPIQAAGFGDFVVNTAHRSLWPALTLMDHCIRVCNERYELTYGFPNQKAAPICARAGLKSFGEIRRYAMPLSSRAFLQSRMPAWLAGMAASFIDTGLRMRERVSRLRAPELLTCKPADWKDPVIDALWSRRPVTMLISERSSAMLYWRFAAAGHGDWRLCLARDSRGVARGYIAWRNHRGLAEVGDFFTVEPARWTAPLLRAFIDIARAAGMRSVSVEFFGAPAVSAQIQEAGFALRPERRLVFTGTMPLGLESKDCWYITEFDDDADSHMRPQEPS